MELIELIYSLPNESFYHKILTLSCSKKLNKPKKTYKDLGASTLNRSHLSESMISGEEKRGMFRSMQSEIFDSAISQRARLSEVKKKIEEKLSEISQLIDKKDKESLKKIFGNKSLKFSIEDNIESLLNNLDTEDKSEIISLSSKPKRKKLKTKKLTAPLSFGHSGEGETSEGITESMIDSFLAGLQVICPNIVVWDKGEVEIVSQINQPEHGDLYSGLLYDGVIRANDQSVGIIGYPLTDPRQLEVYPSLIKEFGTLYHPNFVLYLGVAVEYDKEKDTFMFLLVREPWTRSLRSVIEEAKEKKELLTPQFILNIFEGLLEACRSFHLTGQTLKWLNLDTVFICDDGHALVFLPFLEPFFSSRALYLQKFETKDKKACDKLVFFTPEVLKRESEKHINLEDKEDMSFFWNHESKQDFWSVAMLILFLIGGNDIIKWKKMKENGDLVKFLQSKRMNKKIKLSSKEKELLNKKIGKRFKKMIKKSIVQKDTDRPNLKELRKELRNAQKDVGIESIKVKCSRNSEFINSRWISNSNPATGSFVLDSLYLPGGVKMMENGKLITGPNKFSIDLRKDGKASVTIAGRKLELSIDGDALGRNRVKVNKIKSSKPKQKGKEKLNLKKEQHPLNGVIDGLMEVFKKLQASDPNAQVNLALKGAKPYDKHFGKVPSGSGLWQLTSQQIFEELKNIFDFNPKELGKFVDPWGGNVFYKKKEGKEGSVLMTGLIRTHGMYKHLPVSTFVRKFKGVEGKIRIDIFPSLMKITSISNESFEIKRFYDLVAKSLGSEPLKNEEMLCIFMEGTVGKGLFTQSYELNQGLMILNNQTFFAVDGGHDSGRKTLYKLAENEKYIGEFRNMAPHGNCQYYKKEKKIMDGYFSHGQPHGKSLVYGEKNSLIFRGVVMRGTPLHGILVKEEQQYEGVFTMNEKSSDASLLEKINSFDMSFEGLVKNYKPNIIFLMGSFNMKEPVFDGMIRIWYTDNSKYLGHFSNGSRSGVGCYEMANGSQFVGRWSQKILDGYIRWYPNHPTQVISEGRFLSDEKGALNLSPGGRIIYKNGDQYVGETLKSKPHGCGVLVSATEKYTGEFENGQKHGYASVEGEKWKFEGNYVQGKKNGLGWLYEKVEKAEPMVAFYDDDEIMFKVISDSPIGLRYIIEPGNIVYLEGTIVEYQNKMPKDAQLVIIGTPKKPGKFWIILKEEGTRAPQYMVKLDKGVMSYAGKVSEHFHFHGEALRILPNDKYIFEIYAHGMLMEACI